MGGAGTYGQQAARILASSDLVSRIVIAGRNVEKAKKAAKGIGDKATAIEADATDEGRVASLAADSDIVVNAAGPSFKVALPGLRAAIEAGVHYCDLNTEGPAMEKALSFDGAAKASGVKALVGIGIFPGLSSLMMMHAAQQLDRVEELRYCFFFPMIWGGDPKSVLAEWRKTGHADASWQDIMRQVAGRAKVYRDRRWVYVDPLLDMVSVALPRGGEATAVPVGNVDPITLPRNLGGVRSVSVLASFFPPEVNKVYCEQGRRIARGEVDESGAAVSFYEHLAAQPKGWLGRPEDYEVGFETMVEAVGVKEDERRRYRCWPIGSWASTSGSLATAALKILRGEIRTPGVLTPVSCLDPLPFFKEVAQYAPEEPPGGKLLHEAFEVLD